MKKKFSVKFNLPYRYLGPAVSTLADICGGFEGVWLWLVTGGVPGNHPRHYQGEKPVNLPDCDALILAWGCRSFKGLNVIIWNEDETVKSNDGKPNVLGKAAEAAEGT